MDLEDIFMPGDFDSVKETEIDNDVSEIKRYSFELDFVEQYEDEDGILHVKTFFTHEDIDNSDLWEVFRPENGSSPLELLLNN